MAADLETRAQVIARFAADIRPLGPANFLYSDGDALFAHGNKRTGGDGTIKPPGLYVLRRCCEVDERAAGVTVRASGGQEVVLFASVPLTTEDWVPLERGELLVARGGEVVVRLSAEQAT